MNDIRASKLFKGWNDTLILSCLQGHMGVLVTDNDGNPASAMINSGDFCFFAGNPNTEFFSSISGYKLLAPKDKRWEEAIENYYGNRVNKILRYAIKKEPGVFDKEKLTSFINRLPECYELTFFNEEIYNMARNEEWSADLCSRFSTYAKYREKAFGTAILYEGKLVSGASPYGIYDGGIDIEIDTKPEFRQKGLATVCGAKLILACLDKGIYPSWDAHDLRSVSLAEKLGYHLDHPYVTYELSA